MNKRGFTLLELLVSATLIAVLTLIGVVSYSAVNKRSRDVKRKSDLEQLRSALEMYRSDNGFYPNVNPGTWGAVSGLSNALTVTNAYLPSIPDDPQPSTYHYYYQPTNLSGANYYGYCLSAYLETLTSPSNTCAVGLYSNVGPPAVTDNYGLKNP